MSLGWKFYIKYFLTFPINCFFYFPALFMKKDRRVEYVLKNRVLNALANWCFK